MDVTKVLASVPILKTVVGGSNAQKNASPTASQTSDVSDNIDISSTALSGETLTADQASDAAQEVGAYLAENDEAIGADANKLSQL